MFSFFFFFNRTKCSCSSGVYTSALNHVKDFFFFVIDEGSSNKTVILQANYKATGQVRVGET